VLKEQLYQEAGCVFGDKGDETRGAILDELDDLRNLFAHNFAGVADDTYLVTYKDRRRCLRDGQPYRLTCGYQFNGVGGDRITLTLDHFRALHRRRQRHPRRPVTTRPTREARQYTRFATT